MSECGEVYVQPSRVSKPDPGYVPSTACVGAIWIAAPANTTGLVGLCQGVSFGQRINPPSSGLMPRAA